MPKNPRKQTGRKTLWVAEKLHRDIKARAAKQAVPMNDLADAVLAAGLRAEAATK